MIIIGSKALELHGYKNKKAVDLDIIASQEEISTGGFTASLDGRSSAIEMFEGLQIEWHNKDFLNNKEVLPMVKNFMSFGRLTVDLPSIETLFYIKRSHIWRSPKFERDISQLLWMKERSQTDLSCKFYKDRLKLTKKIFGDRHPKLNKSNEEFFDDVVQKTYIHDDIHEIVAFGERPVYTYLKYDPNSAYCERDLWNRLPHTQKIQAVQEEAMVIALERFLIPAIEGKKRKIPEKAAFLMALEKICTTLCSGWFRDFAIDNYEECSSLEVSPLLLFENGKQFLRKIK